MMKKCFSIATVLLAVLFALPCSATLAHTDSYAYVNQVNADTTINPTASVAPEIAAAVDRDTNSTMHTSLPANEDMGGVVNMSENAEVSENANVSEDPTSNESSGENTNADTNTNTSETMSTDMSANAATSILQISVLEQTITVFTDKALHHDTLICSISNQKADITEAGLLSGESAHAAAQIKTTVLVDISASVPTRIRSVILSMLNSLVENKSANEAFRLAVFGNELKILSDFSLERDGFTAAVETLQFLDTESKIYDAIFNTIPQKDRLEQTPTFYRTIVITDGVDDTVTGITREELYLKLQSEKYPVDVVAVSSRPIADNKDLSAIVRMSGGRYHALTPETDTAVTIQSLGIGDYAYFSALVPGMLLDGTTRQVDVSDRLTALTVDVKFPVFNAEPVSTQPAASDTTTAVTTTTAATSPTTSRQSSAASSPITTSQQSATTVPTTIEAAPNHSIRISYIIAGILILAVIVTAAVLIILRRNKSRAPIPEDPFQTMSDGEFRDFEKTEYFHDAKHTDTIFTIRLCSQNNAQKTWTLPVNNDLLIGRAEHCPVRLFDKSVSRVQCKIVVYGGGLAIVHLGSSNKTVLNGRAVLENAPLQSGDTIKLGREVLHVDYIQKLDSPVLNLHEPQDYSQEKTESIF